MAVISREKLKEYAMSIFVAAKTQDGIADLVSELLVRANLSGVDSHGVIRIPEYLRRVESGNVNPNAKPTIVRETKATATINANFGFGQVGAMKAMEVAISKAKRYGIGSVTVRNCNHTGRIAEYSALAAEEDMVGIFLVKGFPSIVAPWGGRARVLGTSPLSFAIPAGEEKPIIADFATSTSSEGKIRVKMARGEKVPAGWILDSEGRPSTDASALYRGGMILPFGEFKGYALNLLVEALSGALSGGGISDDFIGQNGIFAQAINIEFFVPVKEFKANMDKLIRRIRNTPPAEGFKQVLLPGEPEFMEMEMRLKKGIPIEEKTWTDITEVGQRYGIRNPATVA